MALDEYATYQLRWMMEHGHSIAELIDELTATQNALELTPGINLSVREAFDEWQRDSGFGGELWACREEQEDDMRARDPVREDPHVTAGDARESSRALTSANASLSETVGSALAEDREAARYRVNEDWAR